MAPIYHNALIIGATSGIGLALASKLVSEGTKVIVTGRRQERLDAFVAEHGKEKAIGIAFDITDFSLVPVFVRRLKEEHADIDCVIINAGIQRSFNLVEPNSVDLGQINDEIATNYTGPVHLTMALLPLLQDKHKSTVVYMSATLGLVPSLLGTPNYNATKAALHQFILVLREQLKRASQNIQVVEVFPPAVQTELHDERHQPNLKNGGNIGMPLDAFTEELYKGLANGDEQVAVGHAVAMLTGFEAERQRIMHEQIPNVEKALAQFVRE